MESENEASPLLHAAMVTPRRKHICRRIPIEVTITAIILALFLLVVALLILLESSNTSSEKDLPGENNLLASSLKYKKKFPNESWKNNDTKDKEEKLMHKKLDKIRNLLDGLKTNDSDENNEHLIHKKLYKIKSWLEEWKETYNVDNIQDTLEKRVQVEKDFLDMLKIFNDATDKQLTDEELLEILQDTFGTSPTEDTNLLGSPFKYNKKALDQTWQDKKKKYIKSNKKHNKENYLTNYGIVDETKDFDEDIFIDSHDKSSDGSINLLGSPFKFNKKALDKTWQEKKDIAKSQKDFNSKKWDNFDKGYKKIFPLGSSFMSDKETLNEEWKSDPDKAEVQDGSMKWDNVDKGWKKLSDFEDKSVKELQDFYEAWEAAENKLKSEMKLIYEAKKELDSNCETSNKSVATSLGCPFANLLQTSKVPQSLVNCALMAEQVRRQLGRCIDMSFLPKECKPSWKTKCFSAYKYRNIDGTCNNQIHPTWGKSRTPFIRMMAPEYSDGVSSIRMAKSGDELPNPRFLSKKLYSKKLKPDIDVTLLFTSFGLFVDHDMVETAINTDSIPCCSEKFDKYPQSRPKECLQIEIPKDDSFYGPRNVKCLNFVRSLPVHGECGGRREQLNKATSFLDGSAVYGSQIQKTKSLRSFNKGQLRTQYINKTPFMAFSDDARYACGTPSEPLKCFQAGDSRANMLVELTAMHTLWYREHNRIAEELSKINPQWSDETLFQETRRILTAELQHITYNEFLPQLLGEDAVDYFQLKIEPDEYYDGYDETINPSVFNVFAAAAFRFGHSQIKDALDLIGPDNKTEKSVALHETFFNPQILYHNGLDHLLRGAASQKMHPVDSFISEEVREHLFQQVDKDYGHDLAAVGIQRGRDHGLSPYNKWRSACGLSEISSWNDLKTVMNEERVNKLKEVYQSWEDIDLIPGALAEHPAEGSLLGPTYLCIIGRQFKKTRKGDRFWYEMENSVGSFTKDQLQELYNSNIARIICDNSDNIKLIQKHPFTVPSANNPVVNCDNIPRVDLYKWNAYY